MSWLGDGLDEYALVGGSEAIVGQERGPEVSPS